MNGPFHRGALDVFFAACRSHAACQYRFMAECNESGAMEVFGKGEHAQEPALVRADAAVPLRRHEQEAVLKHIGAAGAQRAQPQVIIDNLLDENLHPPGLAVANLVKRARRRLRERALQHRSLASVEGLAAFCAQHEVNVMEEPIAWREDPTDFAVPRIIGQVPVITPSMVLITFTNHRFLQHLVDIGRDQLAEGLVGQSDFKHKVVWEGYTLGVFGAQVWRKQGAKAAHTQKGCRWRKHFVPILFFLTHAENTTYYNILYQTALLLLRAELRQRGIAAPAKIFAQVHSDYAESAKNALATSMPGTLLVNDLEHLFRNLRKHQGMDNRLQHRSINIVIGYIAFSAYLPTGCLFHLFWQYMFTHMSADWGDAPFVAYLRKQYFTRCVVPSSGFRFFSATWWCGHSSRVRPGHPSSQNVIESFNAMLRRWAGKAGHHINAGEFLVRIARQLKLWCMTPGDLYSICGPGQTLRSQLSTHTRLPLACA